MKRLITLFICSLLIAIVNAQSSYYYYNGGKIPLTLNENKVVINIPKTYNEASERIRTNVQVLNTIADEAFDILVISRSDFERLASLDFWKEDANSVILTSSYYTEDNEEVFSTPYLNVKLKEEQDIDILNSYAEEYGLRIVKNMPSMPLWYILALTLDTKKNTLECANGLFESGKFAASTPDLVQAPDGSDPDDYIPFVAKWKQWHVLGFSFGPYKSVTDYFFTDEEETIGEHTYLKLFTGNWDYALAGVSDENKQLQGLFREEDGRVYLYDKTTEQEYCVYDFTLEEGDTFDINVGLGPEADRCVVTKVDHINVKGNELKTITFSSVTPPDEYDDNEIWEEPLHINHKWIEGVGGWSGPTSGWIPNTYDSSWSYHVAYMDSNYGSWYYPFSFTDMWGDNNFVLGQDLVRGEKLPDDTTSDEDELSYEIVDEKLHVTGTMWMQCGPNNYIYCKLKPSDTYNTYQITLQKEEVEPLMDCMSSYVVDLYFNLPYYLVRDVENFVYVDSEGEHPVPNRDKYHPFVEEGKKWECTISWGLIETNIKKEYYSISGDTIVNGITCKKLHGPYSTYAVYEKDGKVYCHEKVNGDFHLLYDFTCHEGDVVNVVNPEGQTEWGLDEYRCTIKKVDTIITKSGHRLKRFTLQAENLEIEFGSEEEYVWIEGVGSPWEPLYPVGYWETAGGSSYLNACYVNGEQLFVGKDIYYGTGIESIHNEFVNGKSSNGKSIYDLSGRRVSASSALPKGVYVRNGRKVVMLE